MVNNLLLLRLDRRIAPSLSAAGQRVAALAVAGASYKEIARECDVSLSTVRNRLHARPYQRLTCGAHCALKLRRLLPSVSPAESACTAPTKGLLCQRILHAPRSTRATRRIAPE
jgi:hypothetical protein